MIKLYEMYNKEQPENRYDFLESSKYDVKTLARFYAEKLVGEKQYPEYANHMAQLVIALKEDNAMLIEYLLRGIGWKESRLFGVAGHRCIYYDTNTVTYVEPAMPEVPFHAAIETIVTLEGELQSCYLMPIYGDISRFFMRCEPKFTQDKYSEWPITAYVWSDSNAVLDAYKTVANAGINLNLNLNTLGFNGDRDILANYAVYEVLKTVGKSQRIVYGWTEINANVLRTEEKENSVVRILYNGQVYTIHGSLLTDGMYAAVRERLRDFYVKRELILERKPLDTTLQLAMTEMPVTKNAPKYRFSWNACPMDLIQGQPFGMYQALREAGYEIDTANLVSIYCNMYYCILLQYTNKTRFFMYNKYKHRLVEVNHKIDKNGRITLRHKKVK